MIVARLPQALGACVVLVLSLGLTACQGRGTEEGSSPLAVTAPPKPVPPVQPQVAVRVVDGDTSRPVRGARVVVSGQAETTSTSGLAWLPQPARRRFGTLVAAPGYEPRRTRLEAPRHRARVAIWRRATQWPMYGANASRTQAHPAIKLEPPFRPIWKRRLSGLVEFPAVVWEGVAYVNDIHGWLQAISVKRGRLLWKTRIGSLIASSPAIDPERRVLVTPTMEPGYVDVVSLATGRVRWRYYIGNAESSPVIRDGVAYFGATNGNVYALDLDRRRPRWVFHGGAKITSSPALVGKRLYFGDYAGRVFALDARNGRILWQGSAGSRVYGTVAVSNGRVFAPSVFSGLSALSARSGRLLWRIPVGVYLYSSPAVFHDRVYFGTYAGSVCSADVRSGRILWSRPAGGAVSGAVQVVDGVVYAAAMRSRITAWNWRSGRELWSFPHGRYVPVSGNGSVLLMHGRASIWGVVPRHSG